MPRKTRFAEFEVTLQVRYELNGEDPQTLHDQLDAAMKMLANRGELSGDTAAEVDQWSYDVRAQQAQSA